MGQELMEGYINLLVENSRLIRVISEDSGVVSEHTLINGVWVNGDKSKTNEEMASYIYKTTADSRYYYESERKLPAWMQEDAV